MWGSPCGLKLSERRVVNPTKKNAPALAKETNIGRKRPTAGSPRRKFVRAEIGHHGAPKGTRRPSGAHFRARECQKKGAEGRRGALGGPEFRAAEKKKDRFSRITKVPLNFLFSQAAPFQKESPQRGKPRDAERNESHVPF